MNIFNKKFQKQDFNFVNSEKLLFGSAMENDEFLEKYKFSDNDVKNKVKVKVILTHIFQEEI